MQIDRERIIQVSHINLLVDDFIYSEIKNFLIVADYLYHHYYLMKDHYIVFGYFIEDLLSKILKTKYY